MSRPGEEMLKELEPLLNEKVDLHLINGTTVIFLIEEIDAKRGIIKGVRTVANRKTAYRASCVIGFSREN